MFGGFMLVAASGAEYSRRSQDEVMEKGGYILHEK